MWSVNVSIFRQQAEIQSISIKKSMVCTSSVRRWFDRKIQNKFAPMMELHAGCTNRWQLIWWQDSAAFDIFIIVIGVIAIIMVIIITIMRMIIISSQLTRWCCLLPSGEFLHLVSFNRHLRHHCYHHRHHCHQQRHHCHQQRHKHRDCNHHQQQYPWETMGLAFGDNDKSPNANVDYDCNIHPNGEYLQSARPCSPFILIFPPTHNRIIITIPSHSHLHHHC